MTANIPEKTLRDGTKIPAIGFGTYKLNGSDGAQAMVQAVRNGYRLLDSAFNYENEGAVGEAVRSCGVARAELCVTSKLPGRHHAYREALATIEESLYRAGLSYYDIYLIHWPNPRVNLYVEAWQALLEAQKRGLVCTPGVCNFLPEHLERLEKETGVLPCINQIELHPFFSQEEMRRYHAEHGILTEAWSPLGRNSNLLGQEIVRSIAEKHGKSASQVVLRWHIQLGTVPIPKAVSSAHQLQNLSVFDFSLSEEEMGRIGSLTKPDGRTSNQDPAVHEEF